MGTSRLWQWTINASTSGSSEPTKPDLEVGNGSRILYYKYQKERASTGTLHYQGCFRLNNNVSLATAKRILGVDHAHMEPARDWDKLMLYCGKEDTRVDGPWEAGEPGQPGKRKDLDAVFAAVRDGMGLTEVAQTFPGQWIKFHKGISALHTTFHPPVERPNVKVYCFYGVTGCGKTRKVYEVAPKCYSVFDMKAPWFDGYNGQKVMLLDDYGPGMLNINFLKRLLDRYAITLPVKGGSVAMEADTVFITTNYMMSDWYPKAGGLDYDALVRRIEWVNFGDIEERARWQHKWDKDNAPLRHRATSTVTLEPMEGEASGAGAKRRADSQLEPTQVLTSDEDM